MCSTYNRKGAMVPRLGYDIPTGPRRSGGYGHGLSYSSGIGMMPFGAFATTSDMTDGNWRNFQRRNGIGMGSRFGRRGGFGYGGGIGGGSGAGGEGGYAVGWGGGNGGGYGYGGGCGGGYGSGYNGGHGGGYGEYGGEYGAGGYSRRPLCNRGFGSSSLAGYPRLSSAPRSQGCFARRGPMGGGYHRNILMPRRRRGIGGHGFSTGMGARRPFFGTSRFSTLRDPFYMSQPRRRRSRFSRFRDYDDDLMELDDLDYWSDADDMVDDMDLYGDIYDSDYESDEGDWL